MGVKVHHPFQTSLVIDGKKYRYLTYEDTRVAARARAAQHRKHTGDKARVICEVASSGMHKGRVHYSIWVRG